MKRTFIAAGLAVMLSACVSTDKNEKTTENPFMAEFTTPFGVPPFEDYVSRLQACIFARHGRTEAGDRGDRETAFRT